MGWSARTRGLLFAGFMCVQGRGNCFSFVLQRRGDGFSLVLCVQRRGNCFSFVLYVCACAICNDKGGCGAAHDVSKLILHTSVFFAQLAVCAIMDEVPVIAADDVAVEESQEESNIIDA